MMAALVALGLSLTIASCLHLAAWIAGNKRLVRITKPFLVPVITVIYLVSAIHVNWIVVAGLLLGFAGDVFMMVRDTRPKALLAGMASFMAGHVMYIIAIVSIPGYGFMEWWLVFLIIPYPLIAFGLHKTLKQDKGESSSAGAIYMLVILTMGACAMLRVFSTPPLSFWLVLAGSTSFIVSDTVLAYEHLRKTKVLRHTLVMATYISAQLLIALGFALVA